MPKADATSMRATMFVEVNGEPYRVTLPNERMVLLLQLAASLFDDGKLGLAPTVLFKFPPANDGVPSPAPRSHMCEHECAEAAVGGSDCSRGRCTLLSFPPMDERSSGVGVGGGGQGKEGG
jgi:hypothetical protein